MMKRRAKVVAVVALVALSMLAVPEAKAHSQVLNGAFSGDRWIAYRLTIDQVALITVSLSSTVGPTRQASSMVWLLGPDGSPILIGSDRPVENAPTAEVHSPTTGTLAFGQAPAEGASRRVEWESPPLRAGSYMLVAFSVSQDEAVQTTELAVTATSGVTASVPTTGDEVFQYQGTDFGGSLNARASGMAANPAVIVGAAVTQQIQGRLFGWFEAANSCQATTSGPHGIHDGYWFMSGAPAGTYTFTFDACVASWTPFLWGADVTLP